MQHAAGAAPTFETRMPAGARTPLAWRITARTGASAGRLVGTWHGEPIAMASGRFDFDAINSMAVFQDRLHVATNTRGWFVLPVDSAALERRARPAYGSTSPLEVTSFTATGIQTSPSCVSRAPMDTSRALQRAARAGERGGAQSSRRRTGFWRYIR